jgi:hypothetical protein
VRLANGEGRTHRLFLAAAPVVFMRLQNDRFTAPGLCVEGREGAGEAVSELHHQPIGFRFLSHTAADVRRFQAGEVINAA